MSEWSGIVCMFIAITISVFIFNGDPDLHDLFKESIILENCKKSK